MSVNRDSVLKYGKDVIRIETQAVQKLQHSIDEQFYRAVEIIRNSTGRVVLTGIGKSGLIARKIVATMNSTGTAAFYLHPTDALHGDLGMVRKEDVVILLSKSGGTDELMMLIYMIKRMGIPMIGILGNIESKIAREMDIVLNVEVDEEACPHDLAPTASTTAMLVMGDALSVALLQVRGFTAEDFAVLHPAGSLGKRLSLRIAEIMIKDSDIPVVHANTSVKDTILEMTSKRLGSTCVIGDDGKLLGIVTDGDLRRSLEKNDSIHNLVASDLMTKNPKVVNKDILASFALKQMESYKITCLVVTDQDHKPIGIVHLHDLLNLGLQQR